MRIWRAPWRRQDAGGKFVESDWKVQFMGAQLFAQKCVFGASGSREYRTQRSQGAFSNRALERPAGAAGIDWAVFHPRKRCARGMRRPMPNALRITFRPRAPLPVGAQNPSDRARARPKRGHQRPRDTSRNPKKVRAWTLFCWRTPGAGVQLITSCGANGAAAPAWTFRHSVQTDLLREFFGSLSSLNPLDCIDVRSKLNQLSLQ